MLQTQQHCKQYSFRLIAQRINTSYQKKTVPGGDEATFVRDELADVPEVSVIELEVATAAAAAAVAVAAARHEQVDV